MGFRECVCEKEIQFVRIDGSTSPKDRQKAVESFRMSNEVKIAIIGITAGGVGLDFSSARNVVFVELPQSSSEMLQAEDRAHRRGQTNPVNIYIFCSKGTSDELHWLHLNKSLFRISSMMNGKYDAVKEIEVDGVVQLDNSVGTDGVNCQANSTRNFSSDKGEELTKNCVEEKPLVVVSTIMPLCTPDICKGFIVENFHDNKVNILQKDQNCPLEFKLNAAQDSDLGLQSTLNQGLQVIDSEPSSLHQFINKFVLDRGNMEVDLVKEKESEEEDRQLGIISAGGGLCEVDVGTESLKQKESLRFEVSHYTGRIHLYLCVPGRDLRPRPLFINFRQEEVDSVVHSFGEAEKESISQLVKQNPAYCNIFQTFINEWSNLRPIERHKLLGKPLQLPLSLELCYLKDTANHGSNGLLKGGSKRRVTPLTEISRQLPEDAEWKTIVLHSGSSKEKEYTQVWSVSGKPLCKLCYAICNGRLSTAPEFFEDLFCNLKCFQEYRLRTSQKFLRQALFQVEHGVCTTCNLDCHKLVKNIRPLSIARRKFVVENTAPEIAKRKTLFDKLVYEPVEGNAWHADHIVPVFKGGGECNLENMRTLCVACHAEVTKAQRAGQCLARKRAKEQLKIVMKGLEHSGDATGAELNSSIGEVNRAVVGEGDEDSLIIHIPGSVYSEGSGEEHTARTALAD